MNRNKNNIFILYYRIHISYLIIAKKNRTKHRTHFILVNKHQFRDKCLLKSFLRQSERALNRNKTEMSKQKNCTFYKLRINTILK
jgi:hypothetical protein